LRLLTPLLGTGLVTCVESSRSEGTFPTSVPAEAAPRGALVANPAKNQWPLEFLKAAPQVQYAYRFALAHHDML